MNKRQNLTPKKGGKAKSKQTDTKARKAKPVGRLANIGWEGVFLKELANRANVSAACKKANVSRDAAYDKKKLDEGFAREWKLALRTAVESLENEAWRRARDGTRKPVFYLGEEVGYIREYSDTMLIFLMKAHKKKYRDTSRVEHSGPNGGPIRQAVGPDLSELSDAQVDGVLGAFVTALTPPTFKTQPAAPANDQHTNDNDNSTDTPPTT